MSINISLYSQVSMSQLQKQEASAHLVAQMGVDICFINSVKQIKSGQMITICLHLIQFVAMAIMIPLDLLVFSQHYNTQILSFFIAATCVTFLNMSSKLIHLKVFLSDHKILLSTAQDFNHTLQVTNPSQFQAYENVQGGLLVSKKIYNIQTNMGVEQINDNIRRLNQPMLANLVKILVLSKDPFNKCISTIGGGCSFALFIYGIVIMSTTSMETVELVVIIIFCVSQFLIQIKVFLTLIFIALLPLLCLLFCIFVCCCGKGERPANLPQAVPISIQIIQRADAPTCSICFQDFSIGESVIILQCSDKHIFHETCIKGWTNLKNTCPICRYDLSQ